MKGLRRKRSKTYEYDHAILSLWKTNPSVLSPRITILAGFLHAAGWNWGNKFKLSEVPAWT